jgi:hypothetical protein
MDRNAPIGLETETYGPAANAEHGDLEAILEAIGASDDDRLFVLPGQH